MVEEKKTVEKKESKGKDGKGKEKGKEKEEMSEEDVKLKKDLEMTLERLEVFLLLCHLLPVMLGYSDRIELYPIASNTARMAG